MSEPLLPNNVEAEEAVLGAILIDQDAVHRVASLVKPADFFSERNGLIYKAMLDLGLNGTPPDYLAVTDLLDRRGQLDKIGGPAYIMSLINATPTSLHAEHYASTIARYAARRELIAVGGEIVAQAFDASSPDPIAFASERIVALEKRWTLANLKESTWADLNEQIGPIIWAWPGWLPAGFLTMIVGEQETGKSMLALRIGACFLCGDPWPDSRPFDGERGSIVWAEAEASQAMNLQRAKDWGLPLDKILHPLSDPLEDVQLNNPRHRAAIVALARRPDVRMVIIDSLSGGHQEEEKSANGMIPTIKWMAEMARDTGKPAMLSHHLRKLGLMDSPGQVTLDRVRGSSGITQMARMVWALNAPDLNKPDHRRLEVIKSNLALKPKALGFTVNDGHPVFGDAPEPPQQPSKLNEAIEFLQEVLADGPMESRELEDLAKRDGISISTLKRAKGTLGVRADKNGDGWSCSLPAREAL